MEKDATYYQACSWAQAQLNAGSHPETLVSALKNQGWEESQAREVLKGANAGKSSRPKPVMGYATPGQPARQAVVPSAASSRHTSNMMIGGTICAIGTAITVGTYATAHSNGGTYTICWGAIAFGAFRFIRGFAGWTSGS